ncbi:MAG: hypothetical protein AB8C95_15710 [Phycisphaeraceae bacterium]
MAGDTGWALLVARWGVALLGFFVLGCDFAVVFLVARFVVFLEAFFAFETGAAELARVGLLAVVVFFAVLFTFVFLVVEVGAADFFFLDFLAIDLIVPGAHTCLR